MANIWSGIRKWFAHVQPAGPIRRWWRPGGILAIVVILVAGMNTLTGSDEEIRAASAPDEKSRDAANLPFDFQFIGQGRITAGAEEVWVIGGIPIHVGDHTKLMSAFHVGDFVSLSGRILDSDVWLADRIELSEEQGSFYTFNSPLDWVRGSIWRIGGHSLLVGLGTELGTNLAASEVLLATFTVLESGAWQALEIKAFDPVVFEPTPAPSPTLTRTETSPKVDPTATIKPASGERSEGGNSGHEDEDEDDDDDGDDKRDDKGKDGDDDDEDEHDDDNHDDNDQGRDDEDDRDDDD